jgi:hypothetical protein
MEPMRLPDGGPQTFRPMRSWLNGQTSPEMLYLETKWASLIPFARATDLLKEVLPVGDLVNAESVRNHLQLTAERIEQELGEERQLNRFEGSEQEWERQPLPDGPITVGIDGGYVRPTVLLAAKTYGKGFENPPLSSVFAPVRAENPIFSKTCRRCMA